ncbi:COBRA-like extracellular glycosyl-phosphatidyl inositol-anchored protein family, putative [Theobroma cacao]|uniref:COBRA-like extracellular glycosyl-phosphatidyl inositol-anchored protein family, putative n=1 Tax=Theobroma cacao TaxID=3641 RepID=A0A061G519_THECC|nr:COBRA-like extracellular glycosyl-phosphatidyl inositol-anchored protein family, putative [Theobroma cacao]
MVGAQATNQGDCFKFMGKIPHISERSLAIVDLLLGVPKNQQLSNYCKGGLLGSWQQDQATPISSFQVSVGHSGTSRKIVKVPKDFYFLGPGVGYACNAAMAVPSSIFFSSDGQQKTRAMSLVLAIL